MNRICVPVILLMLLSLNAAAEAPLVLTLADAVETAEAGSTVLKKQRTALRAAQRRYGYRASVFLPSLEVSASLSSPVVDISAWEAGFSAGLSLSLGAGALSGLRQAPIDLETAEIHYGLTRAEILKQVKKSFFALLMFREQEGLLEGNIDSLKARYEAARYDWEAGRIAEYEVLSARLSYLTLLPQLEDLKIRAAGEREKFLTLLGLPPGTGLELLGSADISAALPGRDSVVSAAGGHGSLRLLELDKARQEEELRELFDSCYPALNIGIDTNLAFPDPGTIEFFQPGYGTKVYSLSLSVDLVDFLPFSPQAEKIKAAGEAIEGTELDIREAARELTTTVDLLLENIGKAERDIQVYLFNMELAEEYYRIVSVEYETGRQDILTLEEADLKLRKARVDLLERKSVYLNLLIDLEYYTGLHLIR